MAILNTKTKAEGNKAYAAHANITNAGYLKAGDTLQTNVEFFDQNGGSIGIQGLLETVADTIPGWDPAALNGVGGITLYNFMKYFCKLIQQGWDPTCNCWASDVSKNMTRFNIQPRGSNGAPYPSVVIYEFVRINDWVFTEI